MATKEAAQVLLDQARFRFGFQMADMDAFRTKTFGVLTASGIIAGLFGSRLLNDHQPLPILAIIAFAGTAAVCVNAVRPVGVEYGPNLVEYGQWLDASVNDDQSAVDIAQSAAHALIDAFTQNQAQARRLPRLFKWQCVGLAVQLVLWSLALVVR